MQRTGIPRALPLMRRCVALLGVLGLAACASSAAPSSSSAARSSTTATGHRCGPAGAQTLAASSQARVYATGGVVHGCANPAGHAWRLGRQHACSRAAGIGEVQAVRVAGVRAGYGLKRCGIDTGTESIIVRRLTTGAQEASQAAVSGAVGPESYVDVGSLVLKTDGSVAWIASWHSLVGGRTGTEVHRLVGGVDSRLDSGAAVRVHSLRLRGSALTWRHGASVRSATLH